MHNVNITIYKDNIIHDVTNVTDKLFRSRPKQDVSIANQSRYEDTDQNIAITSRAFDKYINKVRSRLQAYLIRDDVNMTESVEVVTIDDEEYTVTTTEEDKNNDIVPLLTGDLVLDLTFPIKWQHESVDELTENIHDYLVNSIIFEILRITNPPEATIYKASAEEASISLKYAITTRDEISRYGNMFDERRH